MTKDIKESVKKTFSLARIKYDPKSSDKYIEQIDKIIKYFNKLNEVDTDKIDVTSHVVEKDSLLREDDTRDFDNRISIIDEAPRSDGGFIQVPKVI